MSAPFADLLRKEDRDLPTNASVAGALVATAIRGIGIAVLVVGMVLGLFAVLHGGWVDEPSRLRYLAAVTIGSGVGAVAVSYALESLFAGTDEQSLPAPTLTLIVTQTALFCSPVLVVDPLRRFDIPTLLLSALPAVPIGVLYTGWLWDRIMALDDRLHRGHWFFGYHTVEEVAHVIFLAPVGLLTVYYPQIGVGVICGLFAGNLYVRSYRDIVVPLAARRAAE